MNRMVSRLCACLVAFFLFAALCGGMVARAADGFDYNYTLHLRLLGRRTPVAGCLPHQRHAVQRLPLGWKRRCAPRAG